MLLTPIALLFSRLTHFMKHNTYTNIFNYTHDIVQAHHIERLFTQTYIHFSFSRFFYITKILILVVVFLYHPHNLREQRCIRRQQRKERLCSTGDIFLPGDFLLKLLFCHHPLLSFISAINS